MTKLFTSLLLFFLFTLSISISYPTVLTPAYPNSTTITDIKSFSYNQIITGASDRWTIYSIADAQFSDITLVNPVEFVEYLSDTATVIVLIKNSTQYQIDFYKIEDSEVQARSYSDTLGLSSNVESLTVSSDSSVIVYTQSTYIKIMKQNSSSIFVLSQTLTTSDNLYDSSLSSDGSILVSASKTTFYYYYYNTNTDLYQQKQTITLQPVLANSNTRGILDLSDDGSTLAYVTYQKKLNIAKLSSSLFSVSQTFTLTDSISQIKISKQSWLIFVVYDNTKVRIYANISGDFEYADQYTTTDNIVKMDLSSDNNYLILGTDSTSEFIIRINVNLYEKKMMDNAEIIMFCGVFIGVLVVFIIYCLITRKPFEVKLEANEGDGNNKVHNRETSQREYLNHIGDETDIEINRNSRNQ